MPKNVIFDLDGTLIDSAPSILDCLESALIENHIYPVIPLDYRVVGPPLDATFKKVTGIIDPVIIETLIFSFKKVYDDVGYKNSLPYEGTAEMLSNLYAMGYSLHLATNKRFIPTNKILGHFFWAHFFDSVYTPDSENNHFGSKRDMLESMVKSKNLDPANSIYIGDLNADYNAADSIGLKFIFAEWGYEKKGLFQYLISASDINDLVQKILSEL